MQSKAVYLVMLSEANVEVFTESPTGSFDLAGLYSGQGSMEKAREAVSSLTEAGIESELRYQDSYGSPVIHETDTFRPRVYRTARGDSGPPTREIAAFLFRYPTWRLAQQRGDFVDAGAAIQRSGKLKPFRHLLRYLAGDDLFLIFALYWLSEFDRDKIPWLAELLSAGAVTLGDEVAPGNPMATGLTGRQTGTRATKPGALNPYAELFDFARSGIHSGDAQDFRKELDLALREHLIARRRELILPVVGEGLGRATAEIRIRASEALAEGRNRALTEGLTGVDSRVRAWLESIEFSVQREPWNRVDPNALCVLACFPEDGRTTLAGYIRADVAACLSPLADEGISFRARLFRLDEKELSLAVGVGEDGEARGRTSEPGKGTTPEAMQRKD